MAEISQRDDGRPLQGCTKVLLSCVLCHHGEDYPLHDHRDDRHHGRVLCHHLTVMA